MIADMRTPGFLAVLVALAASCQVGGVNPPPRISVDVPISRMPFAEVHVTWKERRAQHYVFRELIGDYRRTPDALAELTGTAYRFGLRPEGPAFCLFYDDPGEVPVHELRSRVCLPVVATEGRSGPWEYDLLPAAMVAYAVVSGPIGAVPLSYPGILKHMAERNWTESGPIREVYLYAPESAAEGVPVTEVQIPWVPGG